MSTNVTFNGTSYTVPAIADASWGTNVSNYLIAISTGCLQKTGGTFTLTAELDFGATYGLKLPYLKTKTANIAAAGFARLAKTDLIGWRNNANGADLALGINASDKLQFNSIVMADISSAQTLTNKTMDGGSNTFTNLPATGLTGLTAAANGGTGLDTSASTGVAKVSAGTWSITSIVNADVSNSAAIAYSKLNLSTSIVNADIGTSAAIAYSKLNLSTSIVNADIGTSAAIAYSKLNLASAVKLVSDVTGVLPVANGGTNSSSVVSAPAATAWAGWDGNKNLSANNHLPGYRTTATAAATTTLVVGDAELQYFTGSTTQTCKLPVTSTLVLGQSFTIVNNSSGIVTVQSSGANTVQALAASSYAVVTCVSTSATDATGWNVQYSTSAAGGGSVTSVAATVPSFLSISGSPVTTSGTLAIGLSGTALPVANGGTAKTAVTTAPAATSWAGWDANKNLSANNFLPGHFATSTNGGTTTLVVGDAFQQEFDGSSNETIVLPAATTLVVGQSYQIVSGTTGVLTVQDGSAGVITTVGPNAITTFTCTYTGTTAGTWVYTGKVEVYNDYTASGTLTTGTSTWNTLTTRTLTAGIWEIRVDSYIQMHTGTITSGQTRMTVGGSNSTHLGQDYAENDAQPTFASGTVVTVGSMTNIVTVATGNTKVINIDMQAQGTTSGWIGYVNPVYKRLA